MLKQIRKNTSYLFASELVIRILTFIFTLSLARIYGPTEFGVYGLALSIGGVFDVVFNGGLTTIFLQRVAANSQAMQKQLSIFLPLRLILSLGLFVSFAAFSFLLQKSTSTLYALLITALYLSISSISIFLWACFDARQKMGFTALTKFILYILSVTIGMALIFQNAPMYVILGAYVIGAITALITTIIIIQKKFTAITFQWNPLEWKKIISAGWPIAISGTFVLIYTSLDTIFISLNMGEYFVGQYQIGYKAIGTVFILATIINQAHFPSLVENVEKSKRKFQKIFHANLQSMFFWSVPITIGGSMLAERIILFAFGPEYIPGIMVFKILIWNTIIFFASSAFMSILYAQKKQRAVVKVFFLGAATNIILNILIIPTYGIEGAAVTTLVAELIVLIGMYLQAQKHTPIQCLSSMVKPGIAGIVMAIVLSIISIESLILTIGIGATTYFAVYFAQRAWLFPDVKLDSSDQ